MLPVRPYNIGFTGKVLKHFKMLESTHDKAVSLISDTRPEEGTAISADFQSKGRGQWSKSWQSEAGKNVLCSVILYPAALQSRDIFLLNMVASMAATDLLHASGLGDAAIKWPNDILIGRAKIAGILISNGIAGNRVEWSVISLGLNVNQTLFDLGNTQATAMTLQTGKRYLISEVLEQWFMYLEHYYLMMNYGMYRKLESEYNKRLYSKHQKHTFSLVNGSESTISAYVEAVRQNGAIVLKTDDEQVKPYFYGHAKWIIS